MKKFFTILLSLLAVVVAVAEEKMSFADFINRARYPNTAATYAKLNGTLQHKRRGQDPLSKELYFGLIVQARRSTGQIIISGDEIYFIGQSYEAAGSSVIRSGAGKDRRTLEYVGVRPSDLTRGFLYFPVIKELPEENLYGIIPCRVGLLASPDGKEQVKVWIAEQHFCPLKVEFYRIAEDKPFRGLELDGFTENDGVWYPKKIRISGPGWVTRIEFDTSASKVGLYDVAKPERDIIRK